MEHGIEPTLERMEEELTLKDLSPTTVSSYQGAAGRFLRHVSKPSNRLTQKDVREYMLYLNKAEYAASTINQAYFGVRFLYKEVLGKAWRIDLRLHKRPQKVPVCFAREETEGFFESSHDLKYETLWKTMYSTGMRLGEATRLRVSDIDSKAMRILVRNGKGNKDRYTVLSVSNVEQLRTYYRAYRPDEWLFYGKDREHPLQIRTAQKIFQEDRKRAGILKEVTPHSLRHSFATHSMEDGAGLLYIRDLLGHRAIKSTLVYLKVTPEGINRLVNPLDRLMEQKRSQKRQQNAKSRRNPKGRHNPRRSK